MGAVLRTLPMALALTFSLLIPGCNQESTEVSTGNVRIVEGGEEFPLEIPPEFRYPGSSMVFLSTFEGSDYWTRPETTASLRTEDSLNAVANYYQEIIGRSAWNIIQSRRTPDAALFMVESGYRSLLTIIIRPEASASGKDREGREDRNAGKNANHGPGGEHDRDSEINPASDVPSEVPGPTIVKLYMKQSGSD